MILHTGDSNQILIENSFTKSSLCEKVFGVKFDNQLTFDQQVKSLCKKENAKLKAFAMDIQYMGLAKKKLKINSFFAAQLFPTNMDDPLANF